ncbi:WD40 repeat [Dillenia turbinata]|uniref:WD40 repeat n=1 Tax=Dillenia turbinata TaxID=194707 RepID=A0AAN8Z8I5_9MAGN
MSYGGFAQDSGSTRVVRHHQSHRKTNTIRSVLDRVGPVNSDDSVSPLLPGSFIHRNLPLRSILRSELMPKDHRSSSKLNSTLRTCEPELKQRLPVINLQKKVCRYWLSGNCVRGDKCHYLHSLFSGKGLSILVQLKGHQKAVRGIAFPSGSEKLYTCSKDGLIRSWDCHTGQCADANNLGCEIGSLISAGPWVFVGMLNAIKAFNIDTNAEYCLTGPVGLVYAITVERDVLFTGAQDGTIYAWKFNPESNSFQGPALLKGHEGAVVSLVVGANRLYSGSMDHNIKVWDVDTLQCIQTLNGHSAVVMSLLFWDQHLFSCSLDNTVKVWAASEDCNVEVIYTHNEEDGVLALCGALDAEAKPVLLCSCNDNSIHLYELPSFSERGRIYATQEIRSIHIGSGGLLFTGDEAGLVTVWKWVSEPGSQAS